MLPSISCSPFFHASKRLTPGPCFWEGYRVVAVCPLVVHLSRKSHGVVTVCPPLALPFGKGARVIIACPFFTLPARGLSLFWKGPGGHHPSASRIHSLQKGRGVYHGLPSPPPSLHKGSGGRHCLPFPSPSTSRTTRGPDSGQSPVEFVPPRAS